MLTSGKTSGISHQAAASLCILSSESPRAERENGPAPAPGRLPAALDPAAGEALGGGASAAEASAGGQAEGRSRQAQAAGQAEVRPLQGWRRACAGGGGA